MKTQKALISFFLCITLATTPIAAGKELLFPDVEIHTNQDFVLPQDPAIAQFWQQQLKKQRRKKILKRLAWAAGIIAAAGGSAYAYHRLVRKQPASTTSLVHRTTQTLTHSPSQRPHPENTPQAPGAPPQNYHPLHSTSPDTLPVALTSLSAQLLDNTKDALTEGPHLSYVLAVAPILNTIARTGSTPDKKAATQLLTRATENINSYQNDLATDKEEYGNLSVSQYVNLQAAAQWLKSSELAARFADFIAFAQDESRPETRELSEHDSAWPRAHLENIQVIWTQAHEICRSIAHATLTPEKAAQYKEWLTKVMKNAPNAPSSFAAHHSDDIRYIAGYAVTEAIAQSLVREHGTNITPHLDFLPLYDKYAAVHAHQFFFSKTGVTQKIEQKSISLLDIYRHSTHLDKALRSNQPACIQILAVKQNKELDEFLLTCLYHPTYRPLLILKAQRTFISKKYSLCPRFMEKARTYKAELVQNISNAILDTLKTEPSLGTRAGYGLATASIKKIITNIISADLFDGDRGKVADILIDKVKSALTILENAEQKIDTTSHQQLDDLLPLIIEDVVTLVTTNADEALKGTPSKQRQKADDFIKILPLAISIRSTLTQLNSLSSSNTPLTLPRKGNDTSYNFSQLHNMLTSGDTTALAEHASQAIHDSILYGQANMSGLHVLLPKTMEKPEFLTFLSAFERLSPKQKVRLFDNLDAPDTQDLYPQRSASLTKIMNIAGAHNTDKLHAYLVEIANETTATRTTPATEAELNNYWLQVLKPFLTEVATIAGSDELLTTVTTKISRHTLLATTLSAFRALSSTTKENLAANIFEPTHQAMLSVNKELLPEMMRNAKKGNRQNLITIFKQIAEQVPTRRVQLSKDDLEEYELKTLVPLYIEILSTLPKGAKPKKRSNKVMPHLNKLGWLKGSFVKRQLKNEGQMTQAQADTVIETYNTKIIPLYERIAHIIEEKFAHNKTKRDNLIDVARKVMQQLPEKLKRSSSEHPELDDQHSALIDSLAKTIQHLSILEEALTKEFKAS